MKRTITFLLITSLALCSAFAWEPNGRTRTFSLYLPIPYDFVRVIESIDWSMEAPQEPDEEKTDPMEEGNKESEENYVVAVEEPSKEEQTESNLVLYVVIGMFTLNVCVLSVLVTRGRRHSD